jgi:hypothetical protein
VPSLTHTCTHARARARMLARAHARAMDARGSCEAARARACALSYSHMCSHTHTHTTHAHARTHARTGTQPLTGCPAWARLCGGGQERDAAEKESARLRAVLAEKEQAPAPAAPQVTAQCRRRITTRAPHPPLRRPAADFCPHIPLHSTDTRPSSSIPPESARQCSHDTPSPPPPTLDPSLGSVIRDSLLRQGCPDPHQTVAMEERGETVAMSTSLARPA